MLLIFFVILCMPLPLFITKQLSMFYTMSRETTNYGLCISTQTTIYLYGFSVAYWARCRDTRRSTSDYCMLLDPIVSWSSRKLPTVSRPMEQNIVPWRAASDFTWLTFLLRDIGISLSTSPILFCNNLIASYLTTK